MSETFLICLNCGLVYAKDYMRSKNDTEYRKCVCGNNIFVPVDLFEITEE